MLLELQSVSREFAMNDGRSCTRSTRSTWTSPGEALGLVGESGCGKSTLGRLRARALDPTRAARSCSKAATSPGCRPPSCALRRSIQFIYQDPHSALNPRMTILRSVSGAADPAYRSARRQTARTRPS